MVEPKLKLSALPEGFLNFGEIHLLPPRELAYTAYIAHQADLVNEDFWEKIRSAVLESLTRLKPKQLTQCVVSMAERDVFSHTDMERIGVLVRKQTGKFRLIDLISILHAIAKCNGPEAKHISPILTSISARLESVSEKETITSKSLVSLISAVGMLRQCPSPLHSLLVDLFATTGHTMDQFELSACVRAFAALERSDAAVHAISRVLTSHPSLEWDTDPGCMNILLSSLAKIGGALPTPLLDRLFSQLGANSSSTDLSLYPYMLLSCARLAHTEEAKYVCIRLGSTCLRQYKKLKAVSLVLVKEAMSVLESKYADDENISTLHANVAAVTESVIDRFLLLQSRDELVRLEDSKYTRYSSWFRDRLDMCLREGRMGQEQISSGDQLSLLQRELLCEEELTRVRLDALEEFWHSCEKSDEELSICIRILLNRGGDCSHRFITILAEDLMQADNICPRTYIRALQLLDRNPNFPIDPSVVAEAVLAQIHLVKDNDVLPFLTLLQRRGISFEAQGEESLGTLDRYQTECERKLATTINSLKSYSKRMQLTSMAKSIGLNPEDVMHEYEHALFKSEHS